MDHLNRKNICKPILEPISIDEVKKYYGFINNSDSNQTAPFSNQTAVFSTQTAPSEVLNNSVHQAPK